MIVAAAMRAGLRSKRTVLALAPSSSRRPAFASTWAVGGGAVILRRRGALAGVDFVGEALRRRLHPSAAATATGGVVADTLYARTASSSSTHGGGGPPVAGDGDRSEPSPAAGGDDSPSAADDASPSPYDQATLSEWERQLRVVKAPKMPANIDIENRGKEARWAEYVRERTRVAMPSGTVATVYRSLIGNTLIAVLKFLAYFKSGSSAMLSEAVHSVADIGNQLCLILGLRQSQKPADALHPYGYGQAPFFWSLISAVGMFWMGSMLAISHGVTVIWTGGAATLLDTGWEVAAVLGLSFAIDGYVLHRALADVRARKGDRSYIDFLRTAQDPLLQTVVMEDVAACTGVLIAAAGIGLTHLTGNVLYDAGASIAIGALLAGVAASLARSNYHFLLGKAADPETDAAIRELVAAHPAIDSVFSVQSQYIGKDTFAYKIEVDFDGTYYAAQINHLYANEIHQCTRREALVDELPEILSFYAEDIIRLVERSIHDIEARIRARFPGAAFIDIEPDSSQSTKPAMTRHRAERLAERKQIGILMGILHSAAMAKQRGAAMAMKQGQPGPAAARRPR